MEKKIIFINAVHSSIHRQNALVFTYYIMALHDVKCMIIHYLITSQKTDIFFKRQERNVLVIMIISSSSSCI